MDEPNPSTKMSLLARLGGSMRSFGAPAGGDAETRATIRMLLATAGSVAAAVTAGAVWQAGDAGAERRALLVQGEAIARDREQAAAIARALSLPPLDTVLATLRVHLPPGVRLVEAARGGDGVLSLAIDTPDPDALRATLAADPRLGRFRERAQAVRDDGTIRVRLSGEIG